METELLVCTSSYAEWLNEVGNENSTSDYNTIDALMEGVNSSVNEMVLPEMMLPVVENSIGPDNTVQVEVEVHPHHRPTTTTTTTTTTAIGDVEKEVVGEDVEDGVEIVEEVRGPPNQM